MVYGIHYVWMAGQLGTSVTTFTIAKSRAVANWSTTRAREELPKVHLSLIVNPWSSRHQESIRRTIAKAAGGGIVAADVRLAREGGFLNVTIAGGDRDTEAARAVNKRLASVEELPQRLAEALKEDTAAESTQVLLVDPPLLGAGWSAECHKMRHEPVSMIAQQWSTIGFAPAQHRKIWLTLRNNATVETELMQTNSIIDISCRLLSKDDQDDGVFFEVNHCEHEDDGGGNVTVTLDQVRSMAQDYQRAFPFYDVITASCQTYSDFLFWRATGCKRESQVEHAITKVERWAIFGAVTVGIGLVCCMLRFLLIPCCPSYGYDPLIQKDLYEPLPSVWSKLCCTVGLCVLIPTAIVFTVDLVYRGYHAL